VRFQLLPMIPAGETPHFSKHSFIRLANSFNPP
jgi:hypothetical protein